MEQLISKQITTKFDNYVEQYLTAYRKSHSCETTLIALVEHWKLAREKRQSAAVLSTHMSKGLTLSTHLSYEAICKHVVLKKIHWIY